MISKTLRFLLNKRRLSRQRNWAISIERDNLESLELQSLSKFECKELEKCWGKLGLKIYPIFYRMFKTVEGFDSKYLSDDLFYPLIIRALNPVEYSISFEHKALYSYLYKEIKQPTNYVKCINGILFNSSMEVISLDIAKNILQDKSFIIKPTKNSCMGRNVKLMTYRDDFNIDELFKNYGDDFVIQEVINQSSQTAIFNKTSLNTFRVSSLFINGKLTICSVVFRCGRDNNIVDNAGAGGLMVGVDEDGTFHDYAYDNKYKRYYKTDGGIIFSNQNIEEVQNIIRIVKEYHPKYFPNLGFIGWDFALDSENHPILIEVNLGFPGIQMEQLASGSPIFGDRTDEVIDYVCKYSK